MSELVLTPHTPDWPEPLPRHLSASSLKTFSRCPEQWRRHYLLRQNERPGAALVWGGADHYAHEVNFRQKIETEQDLPAGDVLDAFAQGIADRIDEFGGESEVEWGRVRLSDVKDLGSRLVAAYHAGVSPWVYPIAVEEKFELEVEHVPVPLIGYVDLETRKSILDAKTASAKVSEPKPEWRLQGLLYQAARRKPVEFHLKVKTKVPQIYTGVNMPGLRLPLNEPLVDKALVRVQYLVRQIASLYAEFGPDDPWPTTAPDVGWRDSYCGFCGYRPKCHWMADYGKPDLRVVS